MSVKSGSRLSPVPMRQPSISRGWYWIFFRPCRMTWTRWAKLATARLARTPRLSTDQIPSTGLRSGARRELEHAQPCLGSGEGAQLGAEMDVEVIPDQDDDPAGQLAVRGDQQVTVLTPGERLGLALAPPVQVQPVNQAAALAGPVAGQPGDGDVPGAAAADADDRGDPAPRPGPGPRRPQRLAGLVLEDDPAAQGRRRPFTRGQVSFFHTSMALSAMVAAWVASLPCVPGPPLSGGTAVVVIAASLPAPPGSVPGRTAGPVSCRQSLACSLCCRSVLPDQGSNVSAAAIPSTA